MTLPLWIWLLFAILLVGLITLIYSQGNWRTTLSFLGLAVGLALAAVGIDIWFKYLNNHFIGQFDSLGIPFRKAGPGWAILRDAWPLWVVPMILMAALLFGIDWLFRNFIFPAETSEAEPKPKLVAETTTEPHQNISRQLEFETLKRELTATQARLAETIEIAETQLDKKQLLESTLEHIKEDQEKQLAELKDEIEALNHDIKSHEAKEEKLTAITLQQSEELYLLKNQVKTSK